MFYGPKSFFIVFHLELGFIIWYNGGINNSIIQGDMTSSPYSKDLRNKVMNYLKKGKSQKEASEVFGIHVNTISRWGAVK